MTKRNPRPPRNFIVDLLIILFGVSSWVAVNGLWVELPVLVHQLPEGWQLASYIVITSQIANLGPIVFSTARKIWSQKLLEIPLIHASLATVIAASVLLSVFWDRTTIVGYQYHSTALLALTFFISFVDCTSSLLYLPFIANFKEQYVISYLVGAGLSGPLPGILALAQGVGGYPQCINVTVSKETELGNVTEHKVQSYYPPPRFSTNVFFAVLSCQMVISWVAFTLLSKLKVANRERASLIPVTHPPNPTMEENFMSSTQKDFSSSIEKSSSSQTHLIKKSNLPRSHYVTLLIIQGFLCMLHNGILLSIQTYSCLPYGSVAFHLTVTLSSFANPICCFAAMFLVFSSIKSVIALTLFCSGWASYILATAVLSPTPPLVDVAAGAYLVVLSWVLVSGTVAFAKACIANILRKEGGQVALYRCGVVTQIGSAVGAVISFSLINATTVFKSYDPCSG